MSHTNQDPLLNIETLPPIFPNMEENTVAIDLHPVVVNPKNQKHDEIGVIKGRPTEITTRGGVISGKQLFDIVEKTSPFHYSQTGNVDFFNLLHAKPKPDDPNILILNLDKKEITPNSVIYIKVHESVQEHNEFMNPIVMGTSKPSASSKSSDNIVDKSILTLQDCEMEKLKERNLKAMDFKPFIIFSDPNTEFSTLLKGKNNSVSHKTAVNPQDEMALFQTGIQMEKIITDSLEESVIANYEATHPFVNMFLTYASYLKKTKNTIDITPILVGVSQFSSNDMEKEREYKPIKGATLKLRQDILTADAPITTSKSKAGHKFSRIGYCFPYADFKFTNPITNSQHRIIILREDMMKALLKDKKVKAQSDSYETVFISVSVKEIRERNLLPINLLNECNVFSPESDKIGSIHIMDKLTRQMKIITDKILKIERDELDKKFKNKTINRQQYTSQEELLDEKDQQMLDFRLLIKRSEPKTKKESGKLALYHFGKGAKTCGYLGEKNIIGELAQMKILAAIQTNPVCNKDWQEIYKQNKKYASEDKNNKKLEKEHNLKIETLLTNIKTQIQENKTKNVLVPLQFVIPPFFSKASVPQNKTLSSTISIDGKSSKNSKDEIIEEDEPESPVDDDLHSPAATDDEGVTGSDCETEFYPADVKKKKKSSKPVEKPKASKKSDEDDFVNMEIDGKSKTKESKKGEKRKDVDSDSEKQKEKKKKTKESKKDSKPSKSNEVVEKKQEKKKPTEAPKSKEFVKPSTTTKQSKETLQVVDTDSESDHGKKKKPAKESSPKKSSKPVESHNTEFNYNSAPASEDESQSW